jgi:hypothetical protein
VTVESGWRLSRIPDPAFWNTGLISIVVPEPVLSLNDQSFVFVDPGRRIMTPHPITGSGITSGSAVFLKIEDDHALHVFYFEHISHVLIS